MMDVSSSRRSPQEDGELEDGEICDDEPEDNQQQRLERPTGSRKPPGACSGRAPQDYRAPHPFRPAPFLQNSGGPSADLSGPRGASFWERSHRALGKLRYRDRAAESRPERARAPGGTGRGRNLYRRDSPNWKQKQSGRALVRKAPHSSKLENNGLDESFEDLLLKYKQIQLELECIRNQERNAIKPTEVPSQGQQENRATADPSQDTHPDRPDEREQIEKKTFQAFNIRPLRQKLLTPAERDALNTKHTPGALQQEAAVKEEEKKEEHTKEENKEEGKRQNEPTAPNDVEEDEEESESDLNISLSKESIRKHGKDEDDELSELQLRLLALQSASRRWQQKEQQVMKESKEKLNRPKTTPEYCRVTTRSVSAGRGRAGPGAKFQEKGRFTGRPSTELGKAPPKGHFIKHTVSPVSKQARRKQQVRTWKLQQEQKQRSDEEEEKRKREEEIRKIRDLSNQEEQYNRFMKLVGGKLLSHTKSLAEPDYRKSMLKQGLDSALHLYQYDNYDEVAMDTDSETNSPAASPAREFVGVGFPVSMLSLGSAPMRQDVSQYDLDPVGGVCVVPPPPPPPMPPPDELEPPPKPPFADEEEEEEMMLREELLKSLATKRAVRSEDASSGPPSPIRPLAPPTLRSTTSCAGFNSGSAHSRGSSKFNRGATISRAPLVLPRHKAVVVRLNASDDSDSEIEASSSAQCVFGGLESMIKEARRTVEATRPRAVPTAEKENNPLRTPEALPENKKMEYRLLRAELTSRENRRIRKIDAAAGLDSDDVAKKPELNNSEDKLSKHRAQLQKDQALLHQLRQQELRKKESLKMAEAKVLRLKEQLLAAEKVASAHRVQLRKHQEQVERVQHRVAVKQQQALRMERELAGCRRLEVVVDAHYADLMEQKRRLQQLESEYALKIQKLKEAQALRQASNPITPCGVSQPSLHDLTQDKLTLASDDLIDDPDPNEGAESQPANASARRRSFRESGSFTKPNLSHTETSATPPAKNSSVTTAPPAELLLLGLNVDELKLRQEAETLSELLLNELQTLGGAVLHAPSNQRVVQVDSDPMAPQQPRTELKPVPFGPYHSPLLAFKSYRFSPYFRTKEKFSLSSVTFSNSIEPRKCFCRFDLTGTCNDDDCPWQHMRNCTLDGNQLFQDILSYSLPLIGCSEESSTNEISPATERYIKKLFGGNKDRMGSDQKAVLLVSKVNESLRHVPPYTTYKQRRKWRPEPQRPHPPTNPTPENEEENVTVPSAPEEDGRVSECWTVSDVCVTQDDKRYFDSETDDISNLEYSVLESPRDRQLWIKLAYRYLNQRDVSASECMDAALNTLSRALEDNRGDEELWCHYLMLFSRRGNADDVREMCDMAVEHAPHYSVWRTYLSIESSFEGKDAVCERMLQFLMEDTGGAVEALRSFQLLETLLYRTQLCVYTGRVHNARDLLKGVLISAGGCGPAGRLTLSHRALAWLCYIHLCEFQRLPSHLYDPAHSSPSQIVSLEPFLLPWSTGDDVRSPPELLIALFYDALSQCGEGVSPAEQTLACLPLHMNLLHLHRILGRLQEAIALCVCALSLVPHCCPLLEILSELHTAAGDTDEAVRVWLQAHKFLPQDAKVFYNLCKCLHVQGRRSEMIDLFKQFVMSLSDDILDDLNPVTTLQCLLGLQSDDLQRPAASLPHHLHPQIPYLHLTHSLYQVVCGSGVEAVEAFEAALGAVSDLDVVQKLWLDYLLFISSKSPAARELRVFGDLVQRCLNTVPIRIALPYNSTTYWSCFTFHNKVISFYLSFLPPSLHSSALERFRNLMPTNTELSLRILQQEWTDGSMEHLNLQARLISAIIPTCLSFWKIVIAVQKEQKSWAEVQKLYQQALQKLPLCAALWKDRLLFEATTGGNSETLNKLVRRCQAVGVSLSETLSVTSHTLDPP